MPKAGYKNTRNSVERAHDMVSGAVFGAVIGVGVQFYSNAVSTVPYPEILLHTRIYCIQASDALFCKFISSTACPAMWSTLAYR